MSERAADVVGKTRLTVAELYGFRPTRVYARSIKLRKESDQRYAVLVDGERECAIQLDYFDDIGREHLVRWLNAAAKHDPGTAWDFINDDLDLDDDQDLDDRRLLENDLENERAGGNESNGSDMTGVTR